MQSATPKMPRRNTDISVGTDPMTNPNTEEARRLADLLDIDARNELGSYRFNHAIEASSHTGRLLRTLANEVDRLSAENEALRAFYGEEPMRPAKGKP